MYHKFGIFQAVKNFGYIMFGWWQRMVYLWENIYIPDSKCWFNEICLFLTFEPTENQGWTV